MVTLARRRRFGWAPTEGLHPWQFGVRPAGQCGELDEPRDSVTCARAVLLYLYAVRLALRAPFWPYGLCRCELYRGIGATGELQLLDHCRTLDCPDCLTGHIDRLQLPVLYHPELPADPSFTCGLACPDSPTLELIGLRLGLSRQRVHQVEARALAEARATRSVRLTVAQLR